MFLEVTRDNGTFEIVRLACCEESRRWSLLFSAACLLLSGLAFSSATPALLVLRSQEVVSSSSIFS